MVIASLPPQIAPMRTVLPGKPQAKLQAVCTTQWEGLRLVAYISGSALVILSGPNNPLQTLYLDEHSELDAVAIDGITGKIATCNFQDVTIYKPYGRNEGVLKWSYESAFQISKHENIRFTLSWGSEEELLVSFDSLRIYKIAEDNQLIWNRKLPKPVMIAIFSYNSSLIASTGFHDRLIKLWRRQSFGSDDTRFDFTYLPHPTAVTAVHWRRPHERQHTIDNVLFSVCADSKIRIWAATDPHGLQALQLWAEIDMQEAIQPRDLEPTSAANERYAFFIDSKDITCGAERALKATHGREKEGNHALEHLLEVSKANPEVCVVLDRRGNMSAWGLENLGCKARNITDKFNIAHVENVNLLFLQDVKPDDEDHVQFLSFCRQDSVSSLTLLVHHFDGRIVWFESTLEEFLDPSPRRHRLHPKALWTGHDGSIKKIIRSGSGKALVSRTNDNEALIWKQGHDRAEMALTRSSSLSCSGHIHRSWLLDEGDFVVILHHQSITLWDARLSAAKQIASCNFHSDGKPLCLLLLPCPGSAQSSYIATITSKMEGIVWEVKLPLKARDNANGDIGPTMIEFYSSRLGLSDDLAFVLPVDPAGSPPVVSGFLDSFAKDLAIAYTNSGILRAWTATIDLRRKSVNWLITSMIETNIERPSLASGSSIRKIAVVDEAKTGLTIWDPWSAQLEHSSNYESLDTIQDLDWSSTPDNQSILAVGFPYKVVILAQLRYDYLNARPAWAPIREIRIKELTSHPIGDSTWLGSGNLVIGAGNQIYVYDKCVSTSDSIVVDLSVPFHQHRSLSIFDLVTYLNGPLPVYHPQFLAQCILAGKLVLVQQIFIGLHKALNFFVAGDELDSFVSILPEDFYSERNVRPMDPCKDQCLTVSGENCCIEERDAFFICGFRRDRRAKICDRGSGGIAQRKFG